MAFPSFLTLLLSGTFLVTRPAQAIPGDIVCRYTAIAPAKVNYYTCTELANEYYITIEAFFELNPGVDRDCAAVKPNAEYCVRGFLEKPVSQDGTCGTPYGNTTCLSTDKQCCNGETWRCGATLEDCQPGTCFSGACVGFPSEFSMDGKCGYQHNSLKCGGKWGNCCSIDGQCGTGDSFCGIGKCQTGNCTIIIPSPPPPAALPSETSTGLPAPTPGGVSPDGTCAGTNKYKCVGSSFGPCCSTSGFCGSTNAHCGGGCQVAFGNCTDALLSPDGSCGGSNKFKCKGSGYGDCCSIYGYCGSTAGHCGGGCQSTFGTCTNPSLSPDGTCGGVNGYKCKGSPYGNCCSGIGYCGNSKDYCGAGCQFSFGDCTAMASTTPMAPKQSGVSTDGTCGGSKGMKCEGSGYGNCCSAAGYCGSSVAHCAQGCQKPFSSACLTGTVPSVSGECGPSKGGYTCAGGPFNGQCCSAGGFCGATTDHCKTGCQKNYGKCN